MIAIYVGMYIATIPNRGSPPAILLRQGYREEGKVKNRTLANLTHWPAPKVDRLRRVLRDMKKRGNLDRLPFRARTPAASACAWPRRRGVGSCRRQS